MSLEGVEAALERSDYPQALAHALDAWRGCRRERIAELIERLSTIVARTRARPGGKSVDEKQAAWFELAAKRDPGDVDILLATLTDIRKATPLEDRLRALRGRNDPRIAKAMHALLMYPPIPGATGTNALRLALQIVIDTADPRSATAFRELVAHVGTAGGGLATWGLRNNLDTATVLLRAALDAAPTGISSDDAARLDAIEQRLEAVVSARSAQDPAELFAAVYANPLDDQARSVLADLLQERGDPRGELIALQLARAAGGKRSKREADLLALHAREWLGRIDPVVLKSGLKFERGFVAVCSARSEGINHFDKLIDLPEWSTVIDVDVTSWSRDFVAALLESMPVLRTVRGLQFTTLLSSHPTLERIECSFLERVEKLVALELPGLRAIEAERCGNVSECAPLLQSPLCAQLQSLALGGYFVREWIPVLAGLGMARASYRDASSPWRLTFRGDVVEVDFVWRADPRVDHSRELADLLGHVPDPRRRRVVVGEAAPACDELTAALGRFASHE